MEDILLLLPGWKYFWEKQSNSFLNSKSFPYILIFSSVCPAFVRYLKEWLQNPQWSLSCFLALLFPLSDLQAEVTGMVETNVLDNQLQTGQVEMPTLVGAVKDSGVVDVTLEEGEQQQETISREVEQIGKHEITKVFCDRGSQTRLRSQSISRDAESLNFPFFNSKWVENERKCFKLILQSYCSLNWATLTVSFIEESSLKL